MQRKPTFCWEENNVRTVAMDTQSFSSLLIPDFTYTYMYVCIYIDTHTYVHIFQSMFLSLPPVVFLNDLQNTIGK